MSNLNNVIASSIYVINSSLKEEYVKYFSLVQLESGYYNRHYGIKFCFSNIGDDTLNPKEFISNWVDDNLIP
jgi:hypothetical protein